MKNSLIPVIVTVGCTLVMGCVSESSKVAQGGVTNGHKNRAPASDGQFSGDAVRNFLNDYVPDASIPGSVNGQFTCFVPGMGGASDGVRPSCNFSYSDNPGKDISTDLAKRFMNEHLPDGSFPGAVSGQFNCFVPAMGGISNGVQPSCTLVYGTPSDKQLSGDSATQFITNYLHDAQIPGAVSGQFNCFVPAMGGASNGAQPTCNLMYGDSSGGKVSGNAARHFIDMYAPDAAIPGPVNGQFSCAVPAMGASSDGAKTVCTISTY